MINLSTGPSHCASTFREDWIEGLATAYARTVRRVPGAFGVVRRNAPHPGKVAVVIGGGSGHYPAFAGLVGPGLADAAAIGDVFASPSAEQVYRTARAADSGAGVLFSYGNYAGDVMHFGLAARRLAAEGVETRTVIVTDDVASGPAPVEGARVDPSRDRRGVAGDFFVFKVAGAAAERGDDLEGVARAAQHANAMTRTFGAAFAGCTLPGASEPLFTVNEGTMELGMGIHGEPGLRATKRLNAVELADELVDNLLPELPQTADGRVAVLLNGLGRTKYEELFACYRHVHRRLLDAGLRPHRPEVGEFVTSFDMAGLSLSVMVLDDELADLYDAPCDTPAFRSLPAPSTDAVAHDVRPAIDEHAAEQPDSARPSGEDLPVTAALQAALELVTANEEELGRLDAVAGDGDHGIGIVRGLRAAVATARSTEPSHAKPGSPSAVGTTLLSAGLALADASGGASGALYGALLTESGAGLIRAARTGQQQVTPLLLADAVDGAFDAIVELGGARVGEKTLLDALDPFRKELHHQSGTGTGTDLVTAWSAAASVATRAAADTAGLTPARGRAARMGNLGYGHPDAGAASLALILTAVGESLTACR
ncbi:dihydroxyacetone kinase family protein [Streptomyces coffeae]|uniref:Dihydroxyacetone kinase family protein n=1 Tax=Streptomyces coffeae TaxID=621382 RepID=A0ABS1NCN9_9ACTN|nr:dihydroxyacetone kinase family protein [Streptomyces coffeae]MBL1097734.1 dihydroxyacetone kinase family protein [Streptomyces coffeae]